MAGLFARPPRSRKEPHSSSEPRHRRGLDKIDAAILVTFVASAGLAAWGWGQPSPREKSEGDRGRRSTAPRKIPAKGWKDILVRSYREIGDDDVFSVARSIAFTGMLALFPALAAFVSIYGLFADVNQAREHLAALAGIVPAEVMTLIGEQMVRIAEANNASLSLTFLLSLVLSFWSANSGMKALFKGLNVAYEEQETRSFLRLNLVTLGFTTGLIALFVVAAAFVIGLPILFQTLQIDPARVPLAWLRWPVLLLVVMGAISLLYRFGPSREQARWRWVTPGSFAAGALWIAGSSLFSLYLSRFADYSATYGSLGAVFGFMMWLWLSAVIVLFGAELNAEIEHQTAVDSTIGPPLPLGARGAQMADTVGAAQPGSLWKALLQKRPGP